MNNIVHSDPSLLIDASYSPGKAVESEEEFLILILFIVIVVINDEENNNNKKSVATATVLIENSGTC